jgi:S1-C subfamily serine protease
MAEILKALSQALVETVAALDGSVVRVEGRQRLPASGVVWSAGGLVVTSSHAIERETGLRVGLPGGRVAPATLLGRDPGTDLAVLRAEAADLQAPQWAEAEALQPGSLVLALGRTGANVLATLGILSAVDPEWRTPAGGFVENYVQSDTVMYPGFSGGPLVDASRRVLGVNTSALVSGLSVTLPTATVRRTVAALVEHRRVRRGYLGVQAQPVDLPEPLRERAGQESGLLLVHVEADSPADRSRLIQGDTLVRLDGRPLRSLSDLLQLLDHGLNGQSRVAADVIRAGELQQVEVDLGERR